MTGNSSPCLISSCSIEPYITTSLSKQYNFRFILLKLLPTSFILDIHVFLVGIAYIILFYLYIRQCTFLPSLNSPSSFRADTLHRQADKNDRKFHRLRIRYLPVYAAYSPSPNSVFNINEFNISHLLEKCFLFCEVILCDCE